jgi:hypothetical protein
MKRLHLVLIASLCTPSVTDAASLALSRTTREVTAAEIADGAPAGGYVHEFFVTADSDLLCVGAEPFGAGFFQHSLGSDAAAPLLDDLLANPSLGNDSFIALPSETSKLGGGLSSAPDERVWFDLSDDGPQQNFLFARLTTTGATGIFAGNIFVRGYDSPVHLPFSFALPGTQDDLALLASEPSYSMEYSLDPPSVVEILPVVMPPSVPELPVLPLLPWTPPLNPPLIETPPAQDPLVATDPPASERPTDPANPRVPPTIIESPLVIHPIEWLIDPVSIDIAFPPWRLGDVDGEMLTWVDLRQWQINNTYTLVDATGVLSPSISFFAYDGTTSSGVTLGELRLSGHTADGAAFSTRLASAVQESVIPEPAAGLLAVLAFGLLGGRCRVR